MVIKQEGIEPIVSTLVNHLDGTAKDLHPFRVVASTRVVLSQQVKPATIIISTITGKIVAILGSVVPSSRFSGIPYYDYSPDVIMPGLVDAHVHLNEPGRTHWEGFYTGTQAAAAGGVTTVVDMPLNAIPPTTTVANLEKKIQAAEGKCWVDVGFYGGIIPGNEHELKDLIRHGVRGFKAFLIDSGVDEFPAIREDDMAKAMTLLADEPTTLLFHAEMETADTDACAVTAHADLPAGGHGNCDVIREYQNFLDGRPPALELQAIESIIAKAHLAPNLPLHIVHLSSADAIPLLREARSRGLKVTAETCSHYLALAAEEVRTGDTRYKCCPPIRERSNQDRLWHELLQAGSRSVIQTVVSDHSPCTPDLKRLPQHLYDSSSKAVSDGKQGNLNTTVDRRDGDFATAWGGISSVGMTLSTLWTELTRRELNSSPEVANRSIINIVHWCCEQTALQVGLEQSKGAIRVGMDADLCIFDDTATWTVKPSGMLFRNKVSPYQGRVMNGIVRETWLRGQRVFVRDGLNKGFIQGCCAGKLLLEPRTHRDGVKQEAKTTAMTSERRRSMIGVAC